MQVYKITPEYSYSGGVILVAATCKEEALAIAFPEDDFYKEDLAYWSEPQLIEVLNANVSEPQVITCNIYIE